MRYFKGYEQIEGKFMRRISNFGAVSIGMVLLLALLGAAQAQGPYQVVIVGDNPPHSSSVVVRAGESIDMRVVVLDVTDPAVAGSSLYLNYDPMVISSISCVGSIYKEFNRCEEVQTGRFLFEGYDTFAKNTGDVIVAVLRIKASANAPAGSSSILMISGPRPGVTSGTPVWGPFWQEIQTPLRSGLLTIKEPEPIGGIRVDKAVDPKEGAANTTTTFNITVRNTGSATLSNVTVIDTLPEGVSYISSNPTTDNVSGRVITWNEIGPMLSNSSPVSVELVARVDREASGELENLVTATGKPIDGQNVTSRASANFTVIAASLHVNKTAYPRTGPTGSNATFTITVENTGKVALDRVTVVDLLPAGLTYRSSLPITENVSGGTITWDNIGPLLSNSSPVSLTLAARVDDGASGNLTDTVTATGLTGEGVKVTSTAIANFTAFKAGIDVRMKAFPRATGIMFPVDFFIKVVNTGEVTLDNVTLTDDLPDGLIYLSSRPKADVPGQKIVWNLGSLEPEESRILMLSAKLGFRAHGIVKNKIAAEGSICGFKVRDSGFATVRVDLRKNMAYIG